MMASYNPPKENLPQDLYSTALIELKALGVKVPKLKKFKSIIAKHEVLTSPKIHKIFGVGLAEQEWLSEGENTLPKFIVVAITYLQQFIDQEIGLFRKAGNISRQRKLISRLERESEEFQDADPNDVASLLKKWLRDLPEPLIPSYVEEILTRCESLEVEQARISACLFAFLLLPTDHIYTLKYLLQFLSKVSLNSEKNKMGTHNLALIMAPNIFRFRESFDMSRNNVVYTHKAIIQILIENSDKLGDLPPLSFPQPCLGTELTVSSDVLDFDQTKSKKKSRNGTVQDIFSGLRKLVGQNSSLRTKTPEDPATLRTTPYVARHTVSLDDLDSPSVPKHKGKFDNTEEKSSKHARRKSFGELFLRRKERKRLENQSQGIDQSSIPLSTNLKENTQEFNFPVNKKDEFEDIENKFNKLRLDDPVPSKLIKSESQPIASTSSDKSSVICDKSYAKCVEKSETCIPYMSCKTQGSISNTKATEVEFPSDYKYGLSRNEAFSSKHIKSKAQKVHTNRTKDKSKENEKIVSRRLIENLNSAGLNSNSSFSKNKCGNKTTAMGNKISKNTKSGSVKSRQVSCIQSSVQSEEILPPVVRADSSHSPKRSSPLSDVPTDSNSPLYQNSINKSKPLGLSVQLHLENFCILPTNESPEIHLNIDITSNKSNPELKTSVSNETFCLQKDSRNINKTDNISRVKRTGKHLSSNSDSLIPGFKKRPEIYRRSTFSGSIDGYQYKMRKTDLGILKLSKIPIMVKENKEIKCELACSETEEYGATNNSLFKTPDKHEHSLSWKSKSQYLNIFPLNDEQDISNKRESIARILKENPGHVQRKVSLYDSKLLSTSSSNSSINTKNYPEKSSSELVRASSAKYTSGRRYNRLKLSTTNNCDLAYRSNSVKHKTTFN